MFCTTEITMFSTLSSCKEFHFGTADKWHVYADSFMTHTLFVLCCNKALNCYTNRMSGSTCYYCVRQKGCL